MNFSKKIYQIILRILAWPDIMLNLIKIKIIVSKFIILIYILILSNLCPLIDLSINGILLFFNINHTKPVKHGACLGIGLAAMGTARQDIYEELKNNLHKDDAVTGEAAGIAIGLVMLGTNNVQSIQDMLVYAQDTQHEKILRGLAIGIALCMYGRLEESKALVETLIHDKDPILRRSAMYTIAMAYCGTGNNEAIRRLLHVAVSDVNDDVRRAAVEALGFILFRTPEQCPSIVSLLSESYNPHVRYGAAMALGIACAGTGNKEALAVLGENLLNNIIFGEVDTKLKCFYFST